jgi:hypothetical protein
VSRTTAELVKGVLMDDYGARLDGTPPDLAPYVDTASSLIDDVATCAARKGKPLSAAKLELLERWMAAHYYTKSDRTFASKSTGGASVAYITDPETPEPYKSAALDLDTSGCLAAILKRQRASGNWLGKTASESLTYDQRN